MGLFGLFTIDGSIKTCRQGDVNLHQTPCTSAGVGQRERWSPPTCAEPVCLWLGCGGAVTCQYDVGDVGVIAVAKVLRVLQAAPGEAHHGCLRVVEGGALVVKAGGADGVLYHVELLQLKKQNKITEL